MGKFNYLLGKGEGVKIGEDVFEIKPLTARYLNLFIGQDVDKQAESMFELVAISLQQTDNTITVEDVKDLPIEIFNKVSETIMSVNKLGE